MLAMTVPGRGNQDTEQPSRILQEELASHIPLMPVACDAIQAPQLLGGDRVSHKGEKSVPRGHRAKWVGRRSRVLSATGPVLHKDGGHFPPWLPS